MIQLIEEAIKNLEGSEGLQGFDFDIYEGKLHAYYIEVTHESNYNAAVKFIITITKKGDWYIGWTPGNHNSSSNIKPRDPHKIIDLNSLQAYITETSLKVFDGFINKVYENIGDLDYQSKGISVILHDYAFDLYFRNTKVNTMYPSHHYKHIRAEIERLMGIVDEFRLYYTMNDLL